MKVYVLENQENSGVFSTKEKAIEALRLCAERCEWKEVEVAEGEGWMKFTFTLEDGVPTEEETFSSAILEYELDEEYNI